MNSTAAKIAEVRTMVMTSRCGLPPFPVTVQHQGIARSIAYMVENYHRPIRVSDLRRVAQLSARGYVKAFQRHTGSSPGQLLRLLRIERAKQLLRRHNWRTAEVADSCGFRRGNSFFVAFRDVVGMPPTKFGALFKTSPALSQPPKSRTKSPRSAEDLVA